MMRGYSFRLIPTKQQEQYFWQAAGAARYAYNWARDEEIKLFTKQGIYPSGYDLCKLMTQFKKQPQNQWLNNIHNKVIKRAILDCDEAFTRFSKGQCRFPKKKNRKNTIPSFFVETEIVNNGMVITADGDLVEKNLNKIKFFQDNTVQISGIGTVQLSKHGKEEKLWYLTENNIYIHNGRVKFDGEHWNLTFSLDIPSPKVQLTDEVIGIDLGIKHTAIYSNSRQPEVNINKKQHIKKLEKRKKRYQRQISRKYEANKTINPETGKSHYTKTQNIKKLEKKTAKIDRTLANIRKTYNHKISKEIIKQHPKAIVMENLNIKGMLKNKHLSKAIQQQNLYQLKQFIKYKAESQGTKFIEAPRNFKSTQTCSTCGSVHPMKLSQRVYDCPACGISIDRDLNAAFNLRNYGTQLLQA